jgi:hypothetical protein
MSSTAAKKDLYRCIGVRDYIVWRTFDRVVDWFVLQDVSYASAKPDSEGIIESPHLPRLRLTARAMLDGDVAAVLAANTP